ncbi:MAG: leucine-rich repeat protein [Clostridia bacterium]|nr:leucine-rich repeat protein [Clostridia bacterium]
MKKKLIAGVLAASMCLTMAACDKPDFEDSTVIDPNLTTTVAPTPTSTTVGNVTTESSDISTTETTAGGSVDPIPETTPDDLESVLVGKYVTLVYNAASADVTWEVQKGVGTRENVTFTVKLRDGYLFDGWSEGDAIINGKPSDSTELTYTVTSSIAKKLYLNTSMQIVYNTNGGEIAKAGFNGTDTFSAVFQQNPNTLPEQGYFKRDGYLLTGYNTKADGTGEDVSLGSKITGSKGKIELYCVWEPFAPETDFEVRNAGSNVYIVGYNGTAVDVVVPETIGGKKVVGLGAEAFEMTAVKRVVVPTTVKEIEEDAFYKCTELETLVLFDTIQKISDKAFERCDKFTNVRLNTTKTLIDDWFSGSAAKIDRLIWAKDKKKIVIIGGSGSLMGYNSAVLDEALNGEYEIINFGENANITSIVYFDIVEDFVKEGDIVLWCPEPGTSTLGNPMCSSRFWEFRKSNYDFTKYINVQYYQNFFSSFASFASSLASRKYRDFDKTPSSMSKYGDDMSNRNSKGQVYSYNFRYGFGGENVIPEIVQNMQAKGVNVFYSFAAMQESGMKKAEEGAILALLESITSKMDIVVISDYQDMIFEDRYFYDSAWHLTDEGATLRSEQVAEDLLKALGKS